MKRLLVFMCIFSMIILTSCGKKEKDDKEKNLDSIDSVATTQSAVSITEDDEEQKVLKGENLYLDNTFSCDLVVDTSKNMLYVDNKNNFVQDFTLKVKELDKSVMVQFVNFVPIAIRTDIIEGYSLLECQQSDAFDTTLVYIDVTNNKEQAENLLEKESINILSTKDEIGQIKYSDSRDECDYHLVITGKIIEN